MDDLEPKKPVQIQRWLPYWAVFQADVRQTLRSWVYRVWVLASLLGVAGYLLYRYAPYNAMGVIVTASAYVSDLLHWTVLVSAGLIIVLTAGCIASERGTMADSVLSRGISRYQYFLGKWHARLAAVLLTYLMIGGLAVVGSALLLEAEDLSWVGCLVALLTVAALLAAVISASVAASAVFSTTVMAIAVLWLAVYGGGFALNFLPGRFPAPDRTLQNLPHVLRGQYDLHALGQLVGYSLLFSVVSATVGMGLFARRDV